MMFRFLWDNTEWMHCWRVENYKWMHVRNAQAQSAVFQDLQKCIIFWEK